MQRKAVEYGKTLKASKKAVGYGKTLIASKKAVEYGKVNSDYNKFKGALAKFDEYDQ